MVDRKEKFLKKLSAKERALVERVIAQLYADDVSTLDTKKLKGHADIYRVRIKNIRIIFRKTSTDIRILGTGRRSEKTYKKF